MAGKIIINSERCKGCGLCVISCPKGCIVISKSSNENGYFPAQSKQGDCTGCGVCGIVCPEAIIEVYRDSNIVEVKTGSKNKSNLVKEKA
ncbi:MAG: 4Fe-4S binding protein [Planctomycetes bacterium]|nr:4Fe-4S binding protein [Planctomycetota bacterium]